MIMSMMMMMTMMIMKDMFDDDKTQGSTTYHKADIAMLTLAKEVHLSK